MLDEVRRYATRILLLHLGLLILVVSFVLLAASQVQVSARDEAQTQSKERLQLLADQTARGLESQYASILSDLDVILRDESAATAPASASAPASLPAALTTAPTPYTARGRIGGGGFLGGGARGTGARTGRGFINRFDFLSRPLVIDAQQLALLWRQLRGRVSQIFLVNLNTQSVTLTYPDSAQASARTLARQNIDWLKTIKDAQMSAFQTGDNGTEGSGFHLIAVPAEVPSGGGMGGGTFGGRGGIGGPPGGGPGAPDGPGGPGMGGRGGPGDPGTMPRGSFGAPPTPPSQTTPAPHVVVVVVPIDNVRERFLAPINSQKDHEFNAILINDSGQVLVSNNVLPAGSNLLDQLPPAVRPAFEDLLSTDETKSVPTVIDQPFTIGDSRTIPPQIIASAQLAIAAPRHWTVLVSSPLSDADAIVNTLFRKALAWAVFVSLSVTGILVSTSVFMIRARIRYERTRHDMLTREIEQARHIQLAWLPDLKSVPPGIEVSATNLPASHISGDFYNWFALPSLMQRTGIGTAGVSPASDHPDVPSGKIAIVIGDVTGHGMAAAFLMATTQLLVRMTLSRYQDAGRCLREVNRQLCLTSGGFKGQFVTMLVMVLDTQRNTIQVASAGHPTPIIEYSPRLAGGNPSHQIDPLAEGNASLATDTSPSTFRVLELDPQLVLGVNPDEDYHAATFPLEPAATVLLYTDGVVEAEDQAGHQYTVENLLGLLQSQPNGLQSQPIGDRPEPAALIRAILNDVQRFTNHRELLDDLTLVALRTTPASVTATV